MLDVRDFGAVGDGVTDDSAALKTAFQEGAGRTIYIPAGTYLCSTHALTVYSNTTIIADKGTIIRRGYVTASEGTRILLGAAPLQDEDTIHDIYIKNVIFDGNGVNYGTASFDLTFFSTYPTTNLVIEECDFLDVVNYHAIDLNLCDNVLIRRCRFKGFNLDPDAGGYEAISNQREAIQFDITNSSSDANRPKNVIIEQCHFGASENFGSWYCGVGNHGWDETGETTYFSNVIIRNNIS